MTLIPSVIEKVKGGERAYDIYSRLLEDRIIFIGDQIDSHLVSAVIAQLLFLEKKDPDKDITIYINTPGGEVYSGMAIYDTIQHIKCDVCVIAVGLAASMGSVFLVGGTKGKRYALPHSKIMIHQPLISGGGITGQTTDIQIEAEEMVKVKNMFIDLFVKHTGQKREKIAQDMERNKWMNAEEALAYGLIDKIVK